MTSTNDDVANNRTKMIPKTLILKVRKVATVLGQYLISLRS